MTDWEILENWFTYHPPIGHEAEDYEKIRSKALEMAKVIVELSPAGEDRKRALDYLRSAVMWANASIACDPLRKTKNWHPG